MQCKLMIFLNSDGDLDSTSEIVARARMFDITPYVRMSARFVARTPDVHRRLAALGFKARGLSSLEIKWLGRPFLFGFDALLTATESTLPVHALSHLVTTRANERGLETYTMQQGLENVGLTYFDQRHDEDTGFAAKHIFVWGPIRELSEKISPDVRRRCFSVGIARPKPVAERSNSVSPEKKRTVGVFENLHWHRYSDEYREKFLDCLRNFALARPDIDVIVKSHPKSKEIRTSLFDRPDNIVLYEESGRQAGVDILQSLDAVITTPSTIALDAARAGKPVAVIGFDLDLPYYRPLKTLRSLEDWIAFVDDDPKDTSAEHLFMDRVLTPGDAAGRILETIRLRHVAKHRRRS